MKKRLVYIACFLVLLASEVAIGLFAHDNFIRPFFGDVLITPLLCCLVRAAVPDKPRWLAVYVFIFATAVEFSQLMGLADLLGITNQFLRILMGTSFDVRDILCYAVGCVAFFIAEEYFLRRRRQNSK